MDLRRTALVSLALLAVIGGSLGCGPSQEERRQAAERERQQRLAAADLQRCRRDQAAVVRLTSSVQKASAELTVLNSARYEPSTRPEPPDPSLAARFTQEDRELDELRYRERLRGWEDGERQRYSRWLDEQRSRRDRLRSQLEGDAAQLRRIAPNLLASPSGSRLSTAAVAKAIRCNPADFGLQNSAAAGSSSKAAAN
jgi:hypothetical protein